MNDESDKSRIKETIQKSKTRLNEDNRTKLNELEIFKKVPFEFKDGWTDLIYELGKDIEDLCKLANCELPLIQQIKEKFGTLRFYYNTLNLQYPPIVEKSISALVSIAEIKSAEICEYCGNYGETRTNGIVHTSCEEHKLENSITLEEHKIRIKTPQNRQKAI
ncbi:hypothetical protein L5F68_08265 [Aliarcobacter butzleri]|uniref:hypothetical protein n=1 Tax=Aliarcobacter butzleri TaxID=28197 RepID=UPI001EDD5263|nr:hypothetical protein [Aliarcobacter butzleri]MCG3704326.1 hypothetical protein [Aliarcobacter butzleri]